MGVSYVGPTIYLALLMMIYEYVFPGADGFLICVVYGRAGYWGGNSGEYDLNIFLPEETRCSILFHTYVYTVSYRM